MDELTLEAKVALKLQDENGFIARKDLPDGRYTTLTPQIFTTKLTISRAGDEYGWYEAYEYDDPGKAAASFEAWEGNGEPDGWIRAVPSMRRRPDGDPSKEHVAP